MPDGTQAVLLALGANDMLRGTDPEQMKAALDEILARLRARGIKVMLLGMLAAPNLGPDYRRQYDAVFADLARKHDVPLVPFLLEDVAGVQALNQPDGLHPNPKGVDVMVARLVGPVETFLRSLGPRAPLRRSPGSTRPEEGIEVEPLGHHGELARRRSRPVRLGPVPVELDAILVGIAQVERLADAVVARAVERACRRRTSRFRASARAARVG